MRSVRVVGIGIGIGLVLVAALGLGRAQATDGWCADEPVVRVGGQTLDLEAAVPLGQQGQVSGAELVVVIPAGAAGQVVAAPAGRFPLTTRIDATGPAQAPGTPLQVTVSLSVAAPSGTPVRLTVAGAGARQQAFGTAGAALSLTRDVP